MIPSTNILSVKQPQLSNIDLAFIDLTQRAKGLLNDKAIQDSSFCKKVSPFEVERITENAFKEVCFPPFNKKDIKLVSGHVFPDIIAGNNYGIEVKTSATGGWKSTGSSIVESTRAEDVKKIYMLFANLSGEHAEFECKPYEQCLSGIAVTHSPRYLIDMKGGESIFEKINTPYDYFRSMKETEKIALVRQYYINKAKREGKIEMPWWMGEATQVNLSFYNDLSTPKREDITIRSLILFPELLYGKNTSDGYKKAALWLCNRYSLLCYNMRDTFSAGGKVTSINGNTLPFPYPKIVGKILRYRVFIEALLKHPDSSILADINEYWDFEYDKENLYESWIAMVVKQYSNSKIPIEKHLRNKDEER